MRIADVRVHLVEAEIPKPHRVRSGAGLKHSRQAALVEVVDDDGQSGVGSCSFGSVSFELSFVSILVDRVFKPALVGRDPGATEEIWESLYHGIIVRMFGNRGVGIAILSAIDVALWDLKGRTLGVPVHSLLGGPVRDRVPAYASSIYWDTPSECARVARSFVARGYRAVKVKVGDNVSADIERIEAVREAVGSTTEVLVDANLGYTREVALKVGRELDRIGIRFFEEPLSLDDVEGYGILARRLDTSIAVGENTYTRWGFEPYLDAGVDVVQPDCSRCGGISEARRIIDAAGARHRSVAPHTFSDAVTLVGNLHLGLALSTVAIIEVDETYNPLMTDLIENPPALQQGGLSAPSGAGLGLTLRRDWLAEHSYTGAAGVGPGVRPGGAAGGDPDRAISSLIPKARVSSGPADG